jgi:hypothetical protein
LHPLVTDITVIISNLQDESAPHHSRQPMSGAAMSPDGIPLAFEVHGAGTPTLMFVHGWSCDRSYWRGQVRQAGLDLAGLRELTVPMVGTNPDARPTDTEALRRHGVSTVLMC